MPCVAAVPCRLDALALAALTTALTAMLAACAGPARAPAQASAAPAAAQAPVAPAAAPDEAPAARTRVGALHAEAIERIDSTQRVRTASVPRCGPRITRSLPPPSTLGRMAGWVGLGGPTDGEVPAPDFHTEVVCTDQAVRHYGPAAYRVTYHVGTEAHSVDVPGPPGRRIEVDEAGLPAPVATPRPP